MVEVKSEGIFIDGKREKIVSGAMHYFRIFPEYWQDRLSKLKEMGCNCVETYLAWNLHEKNEGQFDFDGILDFEKFLTMAEDLGLYAIVRPGPYICSECDFGGLPWWLLKYDGMEVRCYHETYLEKVGKYFDVVLPKLKKHLITNGGNVIFLQIENEFGSYGSDKKYLRWIRDSYVAHGMDVPFITSDGAGETFLKRGTLDGVYASINFWNNADDKPCKTLEAFQPNKPLAVMELWNGGCMHWGDKVDKKSVEEVRKIVSETIDRADLVNLYMFHGGTNFGFFAGSVLGKFTTNVTSYDVQAPLGEYGNKTEKYYAEQEIICRALGKSIVNETPEVKLYDYGEAKYEGKMPVSELPDKYYSEYTSEKLKSMEEFGQGYGYIVYETEIYIGKDGCVLRYPHFRDFAHIYIDGKFLHDAVRESEDRYDVNPEDGFAEGKHKLVFFVENLGRVHVYARLNDRKGLIGEMKIFDKSSQKWSTVENWRVKTYPFEAVEVNPSTSDEVKKPYLYKYTLITEPKGDTYIELEGFSRGVVFINGFNIGRYNAIGPQKSLYIPASLLKTENEIIILDVFNYKTSKRVMLSGKQIIDGYTDR